ncbi:AAA family ATPase [Nocardioides sp. CFH 31398]|uniref:AAA family ATPase n=1 Tax=Nocardioides sp. CFH 31398 TaxID=2919579 RepID=UPI001F06FB0B|nr:AAA family ATPase [Nocardioides sp. CFH 31398]MCH1865304.1 AAA family ATPase [Nocardioides sp. CFH 31398]
MNPRILAFVGQNESGKSSVLSGLAWLTEDDETPLSPFDYSRAKQPKRTSGWIVSADYEFDHEDLAVLEPLGFESTPQRMSLWKQADGRLHVIFEDPREPNRDPAPFAAALAALEASRTRLTRQIESAAPDHDEDDSPATWFATLAGLLADTEKVWDADDRQAADDLVTWLETTPDSGKRPRDAKSAGLLRDAMAVGAVEHPREAGLRLMRARVPKFVLFGEDDRDMPTVTAISNEQAIGAMRPAVRNLLAVADVDPSSLWAAHAEGDSGEVQTLLAEGNALLDTFFGQAWNQSNISVRLDLDASGLHAHVYEIDSRRFTRIEERSDGLLAFVALAVFLEAQHLDIPPVLLIDEAETHLHFDAQADLVGVLLKQIDASQVLYSTHSPGCLPGDLGTGIRLLRRNGAASEIHSHFWTNEAPGFGPLLFAMGAGAAAFSVCRWAVLAEGPSEMILLPTLLRLATGLDDLPYQVAPGLSNARAYGMEVEEVAARVVYLADGDADGQRYLRELKSSGVDEQRLFQLPPGTALEDLLDREFYLGVLAKMLPDDSPTPDTSAISADQTISRSLQQWAAAQKPKVKLPGKVAMAYAVLDQQEIVLDKNAAQVLRELHGDFEASLRANATAQSSGR